MRIDTFDIELKYLKGLRYNISKDANEKIDEL